MVETVFDKVAELKAFNFIEKRLQLVQFIQQLQERFDQKVIQDPQNAQGHKNMRLFFFYFIFTEFPFTIKKW